MAAPVLCLAQTITTIAGGGVGDGGPAVSARVPGTHKMAFDASGHLFIAECSGNRVRRVDAVTGIITTVAGTGGAGFAGDGGPATVALFDCPVDVAIAANGDLFVADSHNQRVRRISGGTITTFAGTGVANDQGDGRPALQAAFYEPKGLAFDAAGNLYVSGYDRVRRIDTTGIVTTVVMTGWPDQLAFGPNGALYIASLSDNSVRQVDLATGTKTLVAGGIGQVFSGDGGQAAQAGLNGSRGIAFDAAGNLFIADTFNGRARRVDAATGVITSVYGPQGFVRAVAVDPSGRLYVGDDYSIRRLESGSFVPFAGNTAGDEGGPAVAATLVRPEAIALYGGAGDMLIIEGDVGRVRRVAGATGNITTNPDMGLEFPDGVAIHQLSGDAYVADTQHHVVKKIAAGTGAVSVFAGTGTSGIGGDNGPAAAAQLSYPTGLAVGAGGELYITERASHRIRRVSGGTITTVAGTGTSGFSGDGGPAISARLTEPSGIALDAAGNLFILDAGNLRVRRVDVVTGTITTVAGGGTLGFGGDGGPATSASMQPQGSPVVDAVGNVYFSDTWNHRVRRVHAASGTITTVAGTGSALFSGDGGPATKASLARPWGLALDAAGRLLIADSTNNRVRQVTLSGVSASPGSLAFGTQMATTMGGPLRLVLTNLGSSAIGVSSLTTSTGFAATHDCATLAAGASCRADVTFTPSSAGAYNGGLVVNTDSGTFTFELHGTGAASLVGHYYQSILRRAPDPAGEQFWGTERSRLGALGASDNETWFAMSSFFFASAEYASFNRDNAGFLTDLYMTFFNRVPDPSGQQFWLGQMSNGMPREVMLASFQHSPEFAAFTQGISGNTVAAAEVNMVMDFYRGLLGRLPDGGGFNFWVSQFRAAQCQGSGAAHAVAALAWSMSEQFADGAEYAGKNRTNAQYVGDLYNAFLRRGGDLTGVKSWINGLTNGTYTRRQVRDAFRTSTEFQGRVNNVVAQGCLS